MDEGVPRPRLRRHVDRDDHRPFEALGAVQGDDVDRIAFGIQLALARGAHLLQIARCIANEAFESAPGIGPRPLDEGFDVGDGAPAGFRLAQRKDSS